MAYFVQAPHPQYPHRTIGISIDAFDDATAADLALALFTTYQLPGLYIPSNAQYLPQGTYLISYSFNSYPRLTTLYAPNLRQAKLIMETLAEDGTLVYSDAPIA